MKTEPEDTPLKDEVRRMLKEVSEDSLLMDGGKGGGMRERTPVRLIEDAASQDQSEKD